MPRKPFEVPIPVEPVGRGVYQKHILATGNVDGPNGSIAVELSAHEAMQEGSAEPVSEPMKLGVSFEGRSYTIDVTELLERIVNGSFREDPPLRLQ